MSYFGGESQNNRGLNICSIKLRHNILFGSVLNTLQPKYIFIHLLLIFTQIMACSLLMACCLHAHSLNLHSSLGCFLFLFLFWKMATFMAVAVPKHLSLHNHIQKKSVVWFFLKNEVNSFLWLFSKPLFKYNFMIWVIF